MSENTQLSSEQSATPKTDAAIFPNVNWAGSKAQVVSADFARDQERRIAELEEWLDRLLPGWRKAEARDYEEALVTSQRQQITELEAKCERLIQTAMARGDQ